MKKSFLASWMLMLSMTFFFASCGKENEPDNNPGGTDNTSTGSVYLSDISVRAKTTNSLTLETTIKDADDISWINCGYCWAPGTEGDVTIDNNPLNCTGSARLNGVISGEITGLHANTEYLVRAYLACRDTIYYSKLLRIKTNESSGQGGNDNASISFDLLRSDHNGTIYFEVTARSYQQPSEAGFYYRRGSDAPNEKDPNIILFPNGGDEVTIEMGENNSVLVKGEKGGFEEGHRYAFLPYMKFSDGSVVYGDYRDVEIKGKATPQEDYITIDTILAITNNGFDFVINASSDYQPSAAGLCYSTSNQNPTMEDNLIAVFPEQSTNLSDLRIDPDADPIEVSGKVTGLASGTTYYMRPYMQVGSNAPIYGNVKTVTTL